VEITGQLKQWHKMTLVIPEGPFATEESSVFLNYRLSATFTQGSTSVEVPGYFAADRDAANSGASSGSVWHVHFCPRSTGEWQYAIAFRQGTEVAVSTAQGTAVVGIDGLGGSFVVGPTDKSGLDFRGKGMLVPDTIGDTHYLRHDNLDYFIKVGTDSPENLLGYYEFDGTEDRGGGGPSTGLHRYGPHERDWEAGDPTWKSGQGKGIVGAFNYMSREKGMNAVSFLTYNAGGDGDDVWPFTNATARMHYDCSKLAQWEILFSHADKLGIFLHFKMQETENNSGPWGLDGGNLGNERKLYFRELIARFGHHLALNWNMGEENTQTTAQIKDMATYLAELDPYGHTIVIHTWPSQIDAVYTPLLGSNSMLTGVSIQTGWHLVHGVTLKWIQQSASAGKKWVVANDEQGHSTDGIIPDGAEPSSNGGGNGPQLRYKTLWGVLMAGGAGVEAYFGYKHPHSDLTAEDWRSRDQWWSWCYYAKVFFINHLPFWRMENADELVNSQDDHWCLAEQGLVYAISFPGGMGGRVAARNLDLTGAPGIFDVRWYNPRTGGGGLEVGSVSTVTGGESVNLGEPPSTTNEDWIAHVRNRDITTTSTLTSTTQPSTTTTATATRTTATGTSTTATSTSTTATVTSLTAINVSTTATATTTTSTATSTTKARTAVPETAPSCSSVTFARRCRASACKWKKSQRVCTDPPPCWKLKRQSQCERFGSNCHWWNTEQRCQAKAVVAMTMSTSKPAPSCSSATFEDACSSIGCRWSHGQQVCNDPLPCWKRNSQAQCVRFDGCHWWSSELRCTAV
jgi:hypothetical protein